MKTQLLKFTLATLLGFLGLVGYSQGLTTAEMNGSVSDTNGETLPGATVIVLHNPTGTQNGTITNVEGLFRLPNLTVGGPYTVKVSFVGFHSFTKENVYLSLGQSFKINVELASVDMEIPEVLIIGSTVHQHDLFDGNRTGAETVINRDQLENLPSLTGNLHDFLRFTPQANTSVGGMSIAGSNNRYNSLMIDGTMNNDVFGLASNGMNGGSAGVSPISVEAIDQFQVVIAPFDVRQSGFVGGGINAVTKRGTNQVKGSVYYKVRNESMAGKTPGDVDEHEKLADFSAKQYGFTVGGPIIKNKLFFFVNAEIQRDETPKPFNFSEYRGDSNAGTLDQIASKLQSYGYEAGGYGNVISTLDGEKFLAKLNWNINEKHSLMVRHQYTKGESFSPSTSNSGNIYYANTGVLYPSTTHASAFELKSHFNTRWSNNLKIGYTHVNDDRAPLGGSFPGVTIDDGSGTIHVGSEIYSTGNQLKQSILTITDNVQLYSGKHTWTFGTHNEFYSIYNMFMRRAFGDYSFDSVADFMNENPSYYRIGYSLIDDIRGDGSAAAADFNAMQLGLFIQDEFQVNKDLKIIAGIRADVYYLNDDPIAVPDFNSNTIPTLEQYYDLKGAKAGKMPSGNIMWSPRVGFNWDVNGDKTTQLRGGIGIFTSRIPFVWPAGSYTNNGMVIGDYKKTSDITFNPDWKTQEVGGTDAPSGSQIDLYAKNFKYPQMLRANIAVDQKLPAGIIGTLDFMYTKTINNVLWKDVNIKPAWSNASGTGDNRPLYKTYKNGVDSQYGQIMLGDNTNEGYTYNITATLSKRFDFGLSANVSYSYGKAESIFDGTSSQNSSQWNYLVSSPVPKNEAQLGNSIFDMGSRITASISYQKEWLNNLKTTVSLFYNGQDGARFSYIYDDYYGNFTSESYKGPQLLYIPKDLNDINLEDPTQWSALNEFIEQDKYLSKHRGEYAERNASRTPWTNIIDLKIVQDIWVNIADRKQTLQFGFDVFNIGNMLNKDWGRMYTTSNNNIGLIKFEDMIEDPASGLETIPTFSYSEPKPNKFEPWYLDDSGMTSSRWQAQFTVRYIF